MSVCQCLQFHELENCVKPMKCDEKKLVMETSKIWQIAFDSHVVVFQTYLYRGILQVSQILFFLHIHVSKRGILGHVTNSLQMENGA